MTDTGFNDPTSHRNHSHISYSFWCCYVDYDGDNNRRLVTEKFGVLYSKLSFIDQHVCRTINYRALQN